MRSPPPRGPNKGGFSGKDRRTPESRPNAVSVKTPTANKSGKPADQGGHGRDKHGRGKPERAPRDVSLLFGYHSVREALRSKHRKLLHLYATSAAAERVASEVAASGVDLRLVSMDEINARVPRDAVHQGLLLEARPLQPIDLSELSGKGIVLVLDQVTDPHNVGAIIRTAAAFNVEAIVTTERHTPEMTGILAKSASGGLEHVAIASVVNLARALEELGDIGYQRVGLDSEGPADLNATAITNPVALVLGAEGKGLRRLSRENCDVLARLDMPGAVKSLNVSNACAVALSMVSAKLKA